MSIIDFSPKKIIPVILSGGMGTRLWPLSRRVYPKQFMDLNTEQVSLLQETINRVTDSSIFTDPIIVCNKDHRFIISDIIQNSGIDNMTIIAEPCGRNTAPALAVAASYIKHFHDENACILVLPSDHIIKDTKIFLNNITIGKELAVNGKLVTFGIKPTKPETGFGYIKYGKKISNTAFSVDSFVEKPDLKTVEQYVSSGKYGWNAGIFLFTSKVYLKELKEFNPDIALISEDIIHSCEEKDGVVFLNENKFNAMPSQSIDYAVMEQTKKASVIPMDCGWSDAGSWEALWEINNKDKNNNVLMGDSINIDTKNSYISSKYGVKIATLGLDNIVVISTKDSILVADKSKSQDIKKLVERVEEIDPELVKNYRQVYRPWGSYDSIAKGDRYQVKCITVKPEAKLSLQMHHHRAEHWIVVRGTARVTCGYKEYLLTENQSVYIPSGTVHRIENPGKIELEIIEVQSGAYLGEDDIIRFEDTYGRTESY